VRDDELHRPSHIQKQCSAVHSSKRSTHSSNARFRPIRLLHPFHIDVALFVPGPSLLQLQHLPFIFSALLLDLPKKRSSDKISLTLTERTRPDRTVSTHRRTMLCSASVAVSHVPGQHIWQLTQTDRRLCQPAAKAGKRVQASVC